MKNPKPATRKPRHAAKKPRTTKSRTTKAGREIVSALTELADALERGEPLKKRFTVRDVEMPDDPGPYDAAAVRATRQRLNASQPVFARLVGVSVVLVRAWEQDQRKPAPVARRLLDEINRDPGRWRDMLHPRELVCARTGN